MTLMTICHFAQLLPLALDRSIAALPIPYATFRVACVMSGITIKDASASRIPGMLCSGVRGARPVRKLSRS